MLYLKGEGGNQNTKNLLQWDYKREERQSFPSITIQQVDKKVGGEKKNSKRPLLLPGKKNLREVIIDIN